MRVLVPRHTVIVESDSDNTDSPPPSPSQAINERACQYAISFPDHSIAVCVDEKAVKEKIEVLDTESESEEENADPGIGLLAQIELEQRRSMDEEYRRRQSFVMFLTLDVLFMITTFFSRKKAELSEVFGYEQLISVLVGDFVGLLAAKTRNGHMMTVFLFLQGVSDLSYKKKNIAVVAIVLFAVVRFSAIVVLHIIVLPIAIKLRRGFLDAEGVVEH